MANENSNRRKEIPEKICHTSEYSAKAREYAHLTSSKKQNGKIQKAGCSTVIGEAILMLTK